MSNDPMNVWRCDITGNPVGTDTRRIGSSCKCQGCRAAAEIERLRATIHEAEFCLTVAVIPDGHDRCKLALAKLRAHGT